MSDTNATTVGKLQDSVQQANRVWRDTGVQFYLESFERVPMPSIPGIIYGTDDAPVPQVSWSTVRPDIARVFPGVPSTFPVGSSLRTPLDWLVHSAYMYAPPESVFVWVLKCRTNDLSGNPGGDACGSFADGPGGSRSLVLSDSSAGPSNLTLAHELGHFFGLPHTDGAGAIDPATGSLTTAADFWEFFYKPGTLGPGATPHLFFASRDDALTHVASLQPINRYGDLGGAEFVPSPDPLPDSPAACNVAGDGSMSCDVARCACPAGWACGAASTNNRCYSTQPFPAALVRTETLSHGSTELQRGLTGYTADGTPSINIMSYRGGLSTLPAMFANSQVLQIRKHFDFDVPAAAAFSTVFSGSGKRALLTRRRPQAPHQAMDFDGDGRRDIAMWLPPALISGTGEFRVLLSSAGYSAGSAFVVTGFGKFGDIPVLADYTGDGKTDVAMYRPGGAGGIGLPTDSSQWLWCATPGSPAATTMSCSSPTSRSFGTRALSPLAGLPFGGSNPYLTTFDPATGAWRWRPVTCPPSPLPCETTVTAAVPSGNNEPLPGLFDGDDFPDLVSYNPASARFTIVWSSGGYTTSSARNFDAQFRPQPSGTTASRGGAHVVRGITSTWSIGGSPPQWRQRESLALWDPATGNWQMDWTPSLTSGPDATLCQWGQTDDIPLGGLGVARINSPLTQLPPGQFGVFRSAGKASSGDGFLHPRVPVSTSCSTAPYPGSANQGYTPARFAIGSVADMTGDHIPEMWQVDPLEGAIFSYASEPNGSGVRYSTWSSYALPYLAEIL